MSEEVEKKNRIVYVEPNDVYNVRKTNSNGDVEDIQITPPYEDFCIAFNLMVETSSRLKRDDKEIQERRNGQAFTLSWTTGEKSQASFLKGDDFGKSYFDEKTKKLVQEDTYLTTYYTDISFDNYGKVDSRGVPIIVEGLGVSNIQISFESWYTPTVMIKFIDVRGSALFGNEEAIHENNKITIDNIFGCFFTQPYPLYRLQIKGFLGKPVTYQLTCSKVDGRYNSQTGNFELTVNFIGYTYGLLTDIPMEYIIAAPFDTYYGKQYWDKKVSSPLWALDNGSQPKRLYDLFCFIESAVEKNNENKSGISEKDNDELKILASEKAMLRSIRDCLTSFITEIKNDTEGSIESVEKDDNENTNSQLVLFTSKGKVKDGGVLEFETSAKTQRAFTMLVNKVDEYNSNFGGDSIDNGIGDEKVKSKRKNISKEKLPNGKTTCNSTLVAKKIFTIEQNNGAITNITIDGLNGGEKTTETVKNISYNNERKLITTNAKKIIEGTEKNKYNTTFREYCYIIDLYDLMGIISERMDSLNKQENIIKRRVNEHIENSILEQLDFKPYIGNIFKIIMCHLETFIQILQHAGEDIKAQASRNERTYSYLSVDKSNTDIAESMKMENLPPWVGVVNNGSVGDAGEIDESKNVLGWVGEFSDRFLEIDVVHGIMAAARRIGVKKEGDGEPLKSMYFPMTVNDINSGETPFGRLGNSDTLSGLAGYLSIRASQLFGLLCNDDINQDIVSKMGQMDAYNYYNTMASADVLQNNLFNYFGNGTPSETMIEIALCNNVEEYKRYGLVKEGSNKVSYTFETERKIKDVYNKNGRHPAIMKRNNDFIFTSYYDKKGNTILPSELKDYSNYKINIKYKDDGGEDGQYFIPQPIESTSTEYSVADNWLHICNSNIVSEDEWSNKYVNYDMFNIITDVSSINSIMNTYDKIDTGGIKLHEITVEENFDDYLNKMWKVKNSDFSDWYGTTSLSLTKKDLGVTDEEIFSDGCWFKVDKYTTALAKKWVDNNTNIIKYEDGKFYKSGEESKEKTIDELSIDGFKMYLNDSKIGCSIFGHPFYYMQNNIKDENVRTKVKALLFLHAFNYKYNSKVLNVFKKDKTNGIMEVAPYPYLVFLGGLLWRYRQKDDIILFEENEYKYENPGKDYTLFWGDKFTAIKKGYSGVANYDIPISKLFGYEKGTYTKDEEWLPDVNIENQLVKLFEDFVVYEFGDIRSNFELKDRNKNVNEYDVCNFTHKTFSETVSVLYDKIYSTDGKNVFNIVYGGGFQTVNGVYDMITCYDKNLGLMNLLFNDNNGVVKKCKNLYMKKAIVLDACYRRLNQMSDTVSEIAVSQKTYRTYVNKFMETLQNIIDRVGKDTITSKHEVLNGKDKANFDYEINIYYYLKTLWDRWLIQAKTTDYDVDVFFKKNFIFIDSFYRNAYSKLPINLQQLVDIYKGLSKNGSLFTYINEIVSRHHCIFFALPDFIGFNDSQKSDEETMKDVFRAIPFNKMDAPSDNNKFVIVFTSKPSEIASERSGYKYDGFDIWSKTNKTNEAPDIFKSNKVEEDANKTIDDPTRMGYNVPSFGVAVNRQNNHIFKDIRVGMDNPVVTEQSILAYENVTNKGRQGERKLVFHGQDIYNIFSSYSYSCEVEMIGNAQICPLMYFQLMNIPMWRGTYMIYKVVHNMVPGNMTTTFTGMKMSKMPMNWGNGFFTVTGEYNNIDESPTISGISYTGGSGVELQSDYIQIEEPQDHWSERENWQTVDVYKQTSNNIMVISSLRKLYNQLFEEIQNLPENKNKPKWNLCITNVLSGKETSDHHYGAAMDLQVMRYKENGKPEYTVSGNHKPELLKACDILFSNHSGAIRQVILEYKNTSDMKPGNWYNMHLLHVAVNHSAHEEKHNFFIASYDNGYDSINKGDGNKNHFLENVIPEFKHIAGKAFYGNREFFKQQFNNYKFPTGNKKYTDEELVKHFGKKEDYIKPTSELTPDNVNDRIKLIYNILSKKYTKNAAIGILANMWRESGGTFNPKEKEWGKTNKGAGIGICQWTGVRQGEYLESANRAMGTNFTNIADMSLEEQVNGLIAEVKHRYNNKTEGVWRLLPYLIDESLSAEKQAEYFVKRYERPYDFPECKSTQAINETHIQKIEEILSV